MCRPFFRINQIIRIAKDILTTNTNRMQFKYKFSNLRNNYISNVIFCLIMLNIITYI